MSESASSPSDFLQKLKKDSVYQKVSDILHWRDKIESALVFFILNFFYFLITFGEYTVLTLICYLLLAFLVPLILIVGLTALHAHITKQPSQNPLTSRGVSRRDIKINRIHFEHHIDLFVDFINFSLERFTAVLFVESLPHSLKFAFYFWLLTIVGSLFSGVTVLFFLTLYAFVWPRLYEEKNKEIDKFHHMVQEHIEPRLHLLHRHLNHNKTTLKLG